LKLDAILARQKLHRVAATKIACVNGPLEISGTKNQRNLFLFIKMQIVFPRTIITGAS